MLMWEILSTPAFEEWYADLPEDAQDETAVKVAMLKEIGPRLSRPHADTLNDSKHANMKELRVATATQVLRIAFAFDPERRGILLVAGNKGGVGQRQFYRRLITKADELYDAHLAELQLRRTKKGKNDG